MKSKVAMLFVMLALMAAAADAQTALTQVRLDAAVTSASADRVSLTSATGISAGFVIYVDREAMTARSCSTTTNDCTVSRGQLGTAAVEHLDDAIVWTGAANRFYYFDPPPGRCTPDGAYPGQREPWINVLTGNISVCQKVYGQASGVAGIWMSVNNAPVAPGAYPYRPIIYTTSRTAGALVITPSITASIYDVLIASLTYSGTFEVFLPSPTGLLGKRITISDFARLNNMSPGGRTITIRGLFDTGEGSVTLGRFADPSYGGVSDETPLFVGIGATTSFYVGITASSNYYWFAAPW